MDYQNHLTIPSSDFSRICRDVKEFGDDVRIGCSPKHILISVDGQNSSACFKLEESSNIKLKVSEIIEQQFSVRYLNFFAKACPVSDNVDLYLGENMPFKIMFEIQPDEFIAFYLAPKVDSDNS